MLPWTNMIGAMAILLVVVIGAWALGNVGSGDDGKPPATVDYTGWLKSGRQDGQLRMFAPDPMPSGWRATSASYQTGVAPHWHLGMLTGKDGYVGIEEEVASPRSMVHEYVDQDATRGSRVSVAGHIWRSYRDSGGDYALVREVPAPQGSEPETLLVVGSAPPAVVKSFVAGLSTAG